MHHITLSEFFRILKMAVIYWPYTGTKSDQIQSFAVMERWSDINAVNFNKSHVKKDSDFYWSRAWMELQYNPSEMVSEFPVMLVMEPTRSLVVGAPMDSGRQFTDYDVWIFILDQLLDIEDAVTEDYRDVIDLYLEAEKKTKDLFYFIQKEVIIASVDGGAKTVYAKGALDAAGSTYVEDKDSTNLMIATLQNMNETIRVERFDVGDQKLHGVRIVMSVRGKCEDRSTWAYTASKDPVMYDYHKGPYPDPQAQALTAINDDTLVSIEDEILDP